MNIILLGNGGRESAIIRKLAKTDKQICIYSMGDYNNPDITKYTQEFISIKGKKMSDIVLEIQKLNPKFVVIGPEKYLDMKIPDELERLSIPCVGPLGLLANIETNKIFCREFLETINMDFISPRFYEVNRDTNITEILDIFEKCDNRFVVKPIGLTGGKGVKIFLNDNNQAMSYVEEVLNVDTVVLLEEYLEGEEFILLSFCDGKNIKHCPIVKDFKKLSKDSNINTGSMGCIVQMDNNYSFLTNNDIDSVKGYNFDVMKGLNTLEEYGYRGILYGSYMKTKLGIKLIEFNARFGDPEGVAVLELLETDLFDIFEAITNQSLNELDVNFRNEFCLCKYLVPLGYPDKPEKNMEISYNLIEEEEECLYLAGVSRENSLLKTTGSRIIAICKSGKNPDELYQEVEDIISKIRCRMNYRKDIRNFPITNSYNSAGVNIDEGNKVVEKIRKSVEETHDKNVLSVWGDFGGMYDIHNLVNQRGMERPVIVSSTDGVGTKSCFILDNVDKYQGMYSLGMDIVNHCINDVLVKGAIPLMFLDYFASSELESDMVARFVDGVSAACKLGRCNLMGGETAEMPGVYRDGKLDIVGTIFGIVDREKIINGKKDISSGNLVYGIRSSGPHTNGYSLIRKIYKENPDLEVFPSLLTNHRSYLHEINQLWERNVKINGLCHITGGGYPDNIPRVLPEGLGMYLSFKMDELYNCLGEVGGISKDELIRIFNCGYGMLVIVDKEYKDMMPEGFDNLGMVMDGESVFNIY